MNKLQPDIVTMEMEMEEDSKLPTMAEAIAIFDQREGVPTKKLPPVEIQPKELPSSPVVPRFQPKVKAPVETLVPEVIPQKVVPPAKTLAAALKLFVPPETTTQVLKGPSPRLLIILFH